MANAPETQPGENTSSVNSSHAWHVSCTVELVDIRAPRVKYQERNMISIRRHLCLIACLVILSAIGATPVWAASRTTPVEVMNNLLVGIDAGNNIVQAVQKDPWYVGILGTPNFNVANSPTVKIDGTTNTVKIDATTNTVKAAQSGTWSVGVSSMPTVSVNTHAVSQSGTWNVGVTGTPSVAQSGTWNVGILGTANTVKTPPQTQTVQLWSDGTDLAAGAKLYSPWVYTAGFRQVHVVLVGNMVGDNVRAALIVKMGDGGMGEIGKARFYGSHTPGFLQGGDFIVSATYLTFSFQVISDIFQIRIDNDSTLGVTIYGSSYVYLTN